MFITPTLSTCAWHLCTACACHLAPCTPQGIQDFLKQYKKPILQSAFDLQSRLTNQVRL